MKYIKYSILTIGLSQALHAQVIPITDTAGNATLGHVISGDGSLVFGRTNNINRGREFSFSESAGYHENFLGPLPGNYVFTSIGFKGVNHNGSIIAGTLLGTDYTTSSAFIWSNDFGIQLIGTPMGGFDARAISGNGDYVVGANQQMVDGNDKMFQGSYIWSQEEGVVNIDFLGGHDDFFEGAAFDVSDNGIVVGDSLTSDINDDRVAYSWQKETGTIELIRSQQIFEMNDDGEFYTSSASAINSTGSRIVGSIGNTAVRWDGIDAAPVALYNGHAFDINADGSVVVGRRYDISPEGGELVNKAAIRWTEEKGAQTVAEWLADSGVEAGDVSKYQLAFSVSDDGKTVVLFEEDLSGDGEWYPSSAIARSGDGTTGTVTPPVVNDPTPEPIEEPAVIGIAREGDGVLDMDSELTKSLFTGFSFQSLARQLPSTTLNGSHHRLLIDTPVGADGWHTWATGDFAHFDKLDSNQTIGEIGASRNLGSENLRLGLGVGHSSIDQDLVFGGGSKIRGEFLVAELNYKIPESTHVLSALAYYGDWDANVKRGYLNAGLLDSSRGDTGMTSAALRLRADWKDAYTHGKWSITPRIAYTGIDTHGDGYTETGGGFPVTFDAQDNFEHEIRLGADIDYKFTEKTELRTIIEIAKRFEDESALSGTIIGVGGFTFPTTDLKDTWGRLGFELSHKLTDNQSIRSSLFSSTSGADATFSGAISYNFSF